MHDRRSNVETPHPNTCQWIFRTEEYQTWLTGKAGILWIKGKPGSGKSTLMSHLYHEIWSARRSDAPDNDSSIYLEFFFSARGVLLQRTASGMFRSLLCQLFNQATRSRPLLRKCFQDKCALFGGSNAYEKPVWQWQRPELEALFTDMVLDAAPHRQITIFIDALDEAGAPEAQQLVRYFSRINKCILEGSLSARICISCRHYPILSLTKAIEVHVEWHNHGDIANYVNNYIDTDTLPKDDGWSDLLQGLIDRSCGIFQWICLIMPLVQRHIADGDSVEDVQYWIRQVPAELEEMYKHILQDVVDRRYRTRSFQLFCWVCLAIRPLSRTELRHALAMNLLPSELESGCKQTPHLIKDDSNLDRLVRSCSGGLLKVMQGDEAYTFDTVGGRDRDVVQVVHQSVKDFFVYEGIAFFARLLGDASWTLTSCHGALYRTCLTYLLKANVDTPVTEFTTRYTRRKWLEEKYPFIEYAARNFLAHAERAQGDRGHDPAEERQMLSQAISTLVLVDKVFDDFLGGKLPDLNHLIRAQTAEPKTTSLHLAATGGLADLVDFLLHSETKNEIDNIDEDGYTALHRAAQGDHLTVVKLLAEAGADVQKKSGRNETALAIAAGHGNPQVFSYLLKQDVDSVDDQETHSSALFKAASYGKTAIVKLYIAAGADIRDRNRAYGSALQAASRRGFVELVQLLIEAGADVNNQDDNWLCTGNPLHAASKEGHREVVEMLISAGADVNGSTGGHPSALQAASRSGRTDIVKILLEAGADVNDQSGGCASALHLASQEGHQELVKILIEAGADINLHGEVYGSPLQIAQRNRRDSIIRILQSVDAKRYEPKGKSLLGTPAQRVSGSLRRRDLYLD